MRMRPSSGRIASWYREASASPFSETNPPVAAPAEVPGPVAEKKERRPLRLSMARLESGGGGGLCVVATWHGGEAGGGRA